MSADADKILELERKVALLEETLKDFVLAVVDLNSLLHPEAHEVFHEESQENALSVTASLANLKGLVKCL